MLFRRNIYNTLPRSLKYGLSPFCEHAIDDLKYIAENKACNNLKNVCKYSSKTRAVVVELIEKYEAKKVFFDDLKYAARSDESSKKAYKFINELRIVEQTISLLSNTTYKCSPTSILQNFENLDEDEIENTPVYKIPTALMFMNHYLIENTITYEYSSFVHYGCKETNDPFDIYLILNSNLIEIEPNEQLTLKNNIELFINYENYIEQLNREKSNYYVRPAFYCPAFLWTFGNTEFGYVAISLREACRVVGVEFPFDHLEESIEAYVPIETTQVNAILESWLNRTFVKAFKHNEVCLLYECLTTVPSVLLSL